MPILPDNPFKGRQYPGDVILMAVRWYLRYPLAYEHVAELLAERGLRPAFCRVYIAARSGPFRSMGRRETLPSHFVGQPRLAADDDPPAWNQTARHRGAPRGGGILRFARCPTESKTAVG
jgi:hypothetical protein